jgi:hypothetical protein
MMRRNRNQCPECGAEIAANYRFCLACGRELDPADLPEPETAPPPESKREKRSRRASAEPQPVVTEPYSYSAVAFEPQLIESGKKRRRSRLRPVLVLAILVCGAIGGMMYWNEHPSTASDRISWTAVRELDFANIWIDTGADAAVVADLRKNIPAEAIEARANGVADDGMVSLTLDGSDIIVRLAGVPETFAAQCLGDQAINRLNRVLTSGAVVYVMVDGGGRLSGAAKAPQPVFLWMVDSEARRVHFANQELIASGEAEFTEVTLGASAVGQTLERASERAQGKQRGRYNSGSCP